MGDRVSQNVFVVRCPVLLWLDRWSLLLFVRLGPVDHSVKTILVRDRKIMGSHDTRPRCSVCSHYRLKVGLRRKGTSLPFEPRRSRRVIRRSPIWSHTTDSTLIVYILYVVFCGRVEVVGGYYVSVNTVPLSTVPFFYLFRERRISDLKKKFPG